MKALVLLLTLLIPSVCITQPRDWILLGGDGTLLLYSNDYRGDYKAFTHNDNWYGWFKADPRWYSRVLWQLPSKPNAGDSVKFKVRAGKGMLVWVLTSTDGKNLNQIGEFTGDGEEHELVFPLWFYPAQHHKLAGIGIPKWKAPGVLNVRDSLFVDCAWFRREAPPDWDTTEIDSTLKVERYLDTKDPVLVCDILGRIVYEGEFLGFMRKDFKGVYYWRGADGRRGSGVIRK